MPNRLGKPPVAKGKLPACQSRGVGLAGWAAWGKRQLSPSPPRRTLIFFQLFLICSRRKIWKGSSAFIKNIPSMLLLFLDSSEAASMLQTT